MDFWFEFLNIHMNEKTVICHDCHGFKWQNINIYLILIVFLCGPMPLLADWIMTTPHNLSKYLGVSLHSLARPSK
jgi:hypothetical protein